LLLADIRPELLSTLMEARVQIGRNRAVDWGSHDGDEPGAWQVRTHGVRLMSCDNANAIPLRRRKREKPLTVACVGLAAAENPAFRRGQCRYQIRTPEGGTRCLGNVIEDQQPVCGHTSSVSNMKTALLLASSSCAGFTAAGR